MPDIKDGQTGMSSHSWIKDITAGESVRGSYLVKEKRVGTARNGRTFIGMILSDRSGTIESKIWERAREYSQSFSEGDIVHVEGEAESFRGQVQLRVSGLERNNDKIDMALFLESSQYDPEDMIRSLRKILKSIEDIHLNQLIDSFLRDREFLDLFKKAPAAKNFHHNYMSGLLEHTLSVCRLAEMVTQQYPKLDRDFLLTSAFLHDIGKIRELSCNVQIDYTDEGRLLGHLVIGALMIDEKLKHFSKFPDELGIRLKHSVLSHHGQYEFGSPKRPKFLEAVVLHMIDDLDAKINGIDLFIEKDRGPGDWTDFNKLFGQYFLKGKIQNSPEELNREDGADKKQGSLF